MTLRPLLPLVSALSLLSPAPLFAVTAIFDDFEDSEGHFTSAPSFSGTTTGETEPSPSTADRVTTQAYQGIGSQQIFLDDNPDVDVAGSPAQTWRLRHLSGGGTPANNISFANTAEGFVGFYLATSTPNLQASLMLDDGTGLERAAFIDIIPDGLWHPYEWRLSDETNWEPFAGAEANGEINAPLVTIDSIFIVALDSDPAGPGPDQDATFFIDAVAHNPDGNIAVVPEPSALFLSALCAGGFLASRRRR